MVQPLTFLRLALGLTSNRGQLGLVQASTCIRHGPRPSASASYRHSLHLSLIALRRLLTGPLAVGAALSMVVVTSSSMSDLLLGKHPL